MSKPTTSIEAESSRERTTEGDRCPPDCSPVWRSTVFWHSDIEDVMDRIANEAMSYHPDSRAEFFRDVVTAINEHLENETSGGTAKTDSDPR